MSSEEKSLPMVVEELLKKKEVSGQQNTVTEARQKLERYASGLSGVKSKPIDYGQTKRAISLLKESGKRICRVRRRCIRQPCCCRCCKEGFTLDKRKRYPIAAYQGTAGVSGKSRESEKESCWSEKRNHRINTTRPLMIV